MHLERALIGWVAGARLLTALGIAGGCGDGTAEPIVAEAAAPAANPTLPPDAPLTAPGGLCESCSRDMTCGDENDQCLFNLVTEERFCGRDCDEDGVCPYGYECQMVIGSFPQCQPPQRSCLSRAQPAPPPPLAEMRAYARADLNALRVDLGLPPMIGDACLDALAQAAAGELALQDEGDVEYQEACGWDFETRTTVAIWELGWRRAVTAPWREPEITSRRRGLAEARSTTWSRLGVGILLSGDEAWIALTYGK